MIPHVPTAHEVETFTGRFVNTADPDPATICVEDIAHALANTCRYGGHCRRFYSVAEHAVFVSIRLQRKGYPKYVQIAGLHHDDSEAYLGDIPRPIKSLLGTLYADLTDLMDLAIIDGLHLDAGHDRISRDEFHSEAVKAADNWSLFVEARHLLPSQGRGWGQGDHKDANELADLAQSRIVTPDYWHGGLVPEQAESLWLARHRELLLG